jgi:hypothetical protein
MSADDYDRHVVDVFMGWHEPPEVVTGNWPATLEPIAAHHGARFNQRAARS